RNRRMRAEERHRVLGAVPLELLAVTLVLDLICLEQRLADRDFLDVTGLAVDEREVAVQVRARLAQVVDLEHERLELVIAERVDALLEAGRVVEVADHDREALALVLRDEVLHALGDLGLAADVARAQELEHAEDAVLAATRRQAIDQAIAE